MLRLTLDNSVVEDDFFSDSRLIALGTALPAYSLCWTLNNLFGFQLRREPDLDILVLQGKKVMAKSPGTLFDEFLPSAATNNFYYPVFRYQLPSSETSYMIYQNRCGAGRLIPDIKEADFFLFMQYVSCEEPEDDFVQYLAGLNELTWSRELVIENLKFKNNLIF